MKNMIKILMACLLAALMPMTAMAQNDGGGKKRKPRTEQSQRKPQSGRQNPTGRPQSNDVDSLASADDTGYVPRRRTRGSVAGHQWVDLGLSVKWATYNVGATSPEESGQYFAWGEISPKSEYTKKNCKTGKLKRINITGSEEYDAARANWGDKWRMPRTEEFVELINKCKWLLTTLNGIDGAQVTGPNGNSIFLPLAGRRYNKELHYSGTDGDYWSASSEDNKEEGAYGLWFSTSGDVKEGWLERRHFGRAVRPVIDY